MMEGIGAADAGSASTSTSLVMPTYAAKSAGRTRVEETNTVVYRHPTFGTKDVEAGAQGFYTNPQLVRYGEDGIYEPNDTEYKKLKDSGKVYLKITTDCFGVPTAVEYTDGNESDDADDKKPFWSLDNGTAAGSDVVDPTRDEEDTKEHGAEIIIPIADLQQDPLSPDLGLPMNYRPVIIPPLAINAANFYAAPGTDENTEDTGRSWQKARLAEPLEGNSVRIHGLNNHGGIRLSTDEEKSKHLISTAMEASIELYGVAPSNKTNEANNVYDGPQTFGRKLYQNYNSSKAYSLQGTEFGLLAEWPIVNENGEQISALTLKGGHIRDWQLAFEGEGSIVVPTPETYTVNSESATDYRYSILPHTAEDGTEGIMVTTFDRTESFGKSGKSIYQSHSAWAASSSTFIPFPSIPAPGSPETTEYEFDEDWFTVTDNKVTMNRSAVESVINDAINEIEVEVNVTGLVEPVSDGSIRVMNTTTSGKLTNETTVKSNIGHV